jgi:hypothetical protein
LFLYLAGQIPGREFKNMERNLLQRPLPQQQFYVGTDFIGGEDQGYIACP